MLISNRVQLEGGYPLIIANLDGLVIMDVSMHLMIQVIGIVNLIVL